MVGGFLFAKRHEEKYRESDRLVICNILRFKQIQYGDGVKQREREREGKRVKSSIKKIEKKSRTPYINVQRERERKRERRCGYAVCA